MDHNEQEWLKQKVEFLQNSLDYAVEVLKQISIPLVPENQFRFVATSALKVITPTKFTSPDEV